jgi:hypothetical protein
MLITPEENLKINNQCSIISVELKSFKPKKGIDFHGASKF